MFSNRNCLLKTSSKLTGIIDQVIFSCFDKNLLSWYLQSTESSLKLEAKLSEEDLKTGDNKRTEVSQALSVYKRCGMDLLKYHRICLINRITSLIW